MEEINKFIIYVEGLVFFRLKNELSFVQGLIYGGKQMNVEMLMMSIKKFIIYVEGLVFFRLKNDLSYEMLMMSIKKFIIYVEVSMLKDWYFLD
jgi:hypothetical protein